MKLTHALQAICAAQLMFLIYILTASSGTQMQHHREMLHNALLEKKLLANQIKSTKLDVAAATFRHKSLSSLYPLQPAGVALLVLTTKHPPYYNLMSFRINNILQNLPSNWVIQIFYHNDYVFKTALDDNPGMKRHFSGNARIISTEIPTDMVLTDRLESHYRMQPWLWNFIVAENVLVVDGHFAFCSNSPYSIQDFTHFDYIGTPSYADDGSGISLRKKSSMLAVLSYALSPDAQDNPMPAVDGLKGDDDGLFFSQMMVELNTKYPTRYSFRLPHPASSVSEWFAASGSTANPDAFAISGKLPSVSLAERDEFLKICTEGKALFTALHHPGTGVVLCGHCHIGCFGNNMKREACEASICALNLNETHRSCVG